MLVTSAVLILPNVALAYSRRGELFRFRRGSRWVTRVKPEPEPKPM
jgi:hypothetical protein